MARSRGLLLLALLLVACGGGANLAISEEPAVAIARVDGPRAGGRLGALTDAVDARQPRTGALLVAAAEQFDPVTGQTTENPISVYVTASDALGVDMVALALNGNSVGSYLADSDGQAFKNPFIFPAPRSNLLSVPIPGAPSGLVSSELRALATNSSGRVSEAVVLEVQADGSRPALDFSVLGEGPPYSSSSPVTLTGAAADPETGIRSFNAFLNGEAIDIDAAMPASFNVISDGLTAGTQTVRLVATNGVRVANEAVFTFVVEETDPTEPGGGNQDPIVSLLATPTEGAAPLAVSFTASASDPDGDEVTYLYDFGDGTTTAGAPAASYTYLEPGTYTATVTVSDGNGGIGSSSLTITVGDGGNGGGDNELPEVSLGADLTEGAAPLEVTFTAAATDADGDTLSYAWDFGNGETVSGGASESFTYTQDGSYTATVTVADGNGGQASDSLTITVGDGGDGGDPTAPAITSFTADGQSSLEVAPNTEVTLAWEISGTATEVTVTAANGDVTDVTTDDDKQLTVTPTQTTTYTLEARNAAASAAPKTVEVIVTGGGDNGGVEAVDDTPVTTSGQPITINVLENDKPGAQALVIVAATSPRQGGTVAISRDSKTITYTPAAGFSGQDRFSYTVRDENRNSDSAVVTVRVGD